MPRRTYDITDAQLERIGRLARQLRLDMSDVVQLALVAGLPIVEESAKNDPLEELRERLRIEDKGRIKAPSAKRR